jgi:hypothetical protein
MSNRKALVVDEVTVVDSTEDVDAENTDTTTTDTHFL